MIIIIISFILFFFSCIIGLVNLFFNLIYNYVKDWKEYFFLEKRGNMFLVKKFFFYIYLKYIKSIINFIICFLIFYCKIFKIFNFFVLRYFSKFEYIRR